MRTKHYDQFKKVVLLHFNCIFSTHPLYPPLLFSREGEVENLMLF